MDWPKSLACSLLILSYSALAQQPAYKRDQFEVASIKPDPRTAGSWVRFLPGGRLEASVWVKYLIQTAYGVEDYQVIGGPGWIGSQWYDIEAKAPHADADRTAMIPMLQSLLADRFQLKLRKEERDFPAMALVADKNGPELRALKEGEPSKCSRDNSYVCGIRTPADLARSLKNFVGKPVFDETGVTGRYDILLDFDTDTALGRTPKPGLDKPSLTTALHEQLGLRLESEKLQMKVLVIDDAQRPSAN